MLLILLVNNFFANFCSFFAKYQSGTATTFILPILFYLEFFHVCIYLCSESIVGSVTTSVMAITECQWKQLIFNRRLNDGSDPPSTNNGLPTKAFASQTSVVSCHTVISATLQHNLELSFLLHHFLSSSSVLPCALLPASWLPFPRSTCIILWIIPSVSSHMSVLFVPNPMKVWALKPQLWAEHFLGNLLSLSLFSAIPLLPSWVY